ncbi:MAG: phosphoenolpyruvate--protein phosphotransferase [Candidatus Competibacteraceae bacterium]|jgi:phosphotransferase system enzyme I (PtsP)|nr:phosphoenolpyruvate--protein phosphotransferase [Candidatus Competibacteraceae bacterium]
MLHLLRRIVQEVDSTRDLDDALTLIVKRVKAAVQADVCSVYMTDYERHEHVLVATDGLSAEAVGEVRLKFGQGLVGLAASRAEPVNVQNAPMHSYFHYVPITGESCFHGFLGVPIIRRRKLLGVLVVQQRLERKYTQEEESFIVTLAAQLAGSLSQAEIRQALGRLDRDMLTGTLFLEGIASAKGLGIGEAMVVFPETDLNSVPDKTIHDTEAEALRFRKAVDTELQEIDRLGRRMQSLLSAGDRALFDAYALLLGSDSLVNGTLDRIAEGSWAPGALRTTIVEYANRFEEMDDPYLQGRAADIRDLGQRLLRRLQKEQAVPRVYPERTILMGEEIGVSQFLEVPPEKLAGLVSKHGTSASHVALLARGLGIPAVFGVSDMALGRLHGREVVVDGYSARVCVQPSPTLRQHYLKLAEEETALSVGLQELRDLPAQTPDGHCLQLMANSGLFADITAARESGAEGIGLYRSELHFCLRSFFPSEEEQTANYMRILKAMAPRPVMLRTLDVGGDKPLPYFPIEEQNPFLGWRGIRVSLDQPDIFKTQLRAILRAGAEYTNLSILFPMITAVNELTDALAMLHSAHHELLEDGLPVVMPQVGIMVEIPAAVYQIDALAQRVDFVSIGSNDLTQYLLAVDRNNDRVAKLYDSLHPAVLQAIQHVVERVHRLERPVSVCGEMAGDPAAVLLLLAMGVDNLSMSLGNLLKVKWVIRTIPYQRARELLAEVMVMEETSLIRERLNAVLEGYGLGGLIRIGN